MRIKIFFSLIFFGCNIVSVSSDGVLGCGGFVKSDIDVNFSLVEVKLYTFHGSIKYQTDCAPNTGYYLIPLYDKGDFVLKVEPPKGWSFEPESVELHVDGETDKCSRGEDINFVFTGFSLTGKVISKGQGQGPAGVTVNLYKSGTKTAIQSVQTAQDGSYQFTKVMPGRYDIKAVQADFRFEKSETSIEVMSDNADAGTSLVISGYPVTGKVFSEGEPIKGVNFVLYSSAVKQQDVLDCNKSPLSGVGNEEKLAQLCYVASDKNGQFSFPCLPTGEYFLVPFYKGEHITFDVKPERLPLNVAHGPVKLETTFQVTGFSVTGRVLDSAQGSGIGGAEILLNGKPVTKTGKDGIYDLENMKTGEYRLLVRGDNMLFDEKVFRITPNTPQLPDIVPSSFSVCGKVTIDKFPEGLPQQVSRRKIIIFPEGKGSAAVSKETSEDGKFCTSVHPGKYIVRVHLTDAETRAGLTIAPAEQLVTVTNRPVLDITFSQFRARVTGTITCMEKCGAMEVSLDAIGRTDKQITQAQSTQKVATFTFENVLPGKYRATVMRDSLCWKEKTIEFEVGNSNVDNLKFVQTGYILKCTISHPVTMHFAHEQKEGSVGSFELNKGKNRFCLAEPGIYQLTPDSCHKFEKEIYSYDTSNPETLTLTAVSHLVYGVVTTEEPVSDVMVTIESSADQSVTRLGPLTPEGQGNDSSKVTGPQTYKFSHWTRSGEKLTVTVTSSEMLYTPPSTEVSIIGDTCPGEMMKIKGEKGVFIEGRVTPPLAEVRIAVYDQNDRMDKVTTVTSDTGKFRVGPLHKGYNFVVTAEKEGYVLEKDEKELAVFRARKLCRIDVKVTGENDNPLSEVLLSLSGDKQYRSNNLTREDGIMSFLNLSPGQYFLRPMMKEYKFEPVSQMLEVKEGTTVDVSIKGVRIAYSCYGKVTSLNGEPEPGIFVEAKGQGDCSVYQEESKTETSGNYRIRGLQPNCNYEVKLQIGEMNKHIERAAPKTRLVKVEKSDLRDINIIAFRRMNQMDISGNVVTDPEFLPTLKVRLYKEDNPGVPIYTASLGVVSFFYLPSLQMDDSIYSVRLESSLSKSTHDFVQPEVQITANISYKHITFKFEPKRKSVEQELSQSSVLILPLTILIALAVYNYQKLLPVGQQLLGQVLGQAQTLVQKRQAVMGFQQQPQQYSAVEDFDLQDSPVSKKKAKPRKT